MKLQLFIKSENVLQVSGGVCIEVDSAVEYLEIPQPVRLVNQDTGEKRELTRAEGNAFEDALEMFHQQLLGAFLAKIVSREIPKEAKEFFWGSK